METSTSVVPIRPRVGVFSVFEAVDYKAWFALAEFVDNSIQSWLDAIAAGTIDEADGPLQINIDASSGDGGFIRIVDNAGGIPLSRFPTAFEIGSPPPDPTGLSVYGIGMKSAGCWFANQFRITTAALGDSYERVIEYDFPQIIRDGLETLDYLERSQPEPWHGTEVLLTDLKNPIQASTHAKVRSHLTSIYRNFVRDGQVLLTYNGDPLVYSDPEILVAQDVREPEGAAIAWRKDVDLTLSTGERVTGFAAIRRVGRAAGSGFSLYRNRRVITGLEDDPWRPTEIFGYGNSYRSQRIFGELHLEKVKVAYSKNGFVWQASGEELIERLRECLDDEPLPLLRQAERYRAREPEPRQREAARKAIESTAAAMQDAIKEDLPERSQDTDGGPSRSELPTPSERIATKQLEVTYKGQRWLLNVELAEDPDADWLVLADSGHAVDAPRILGIRVNINNSFMRRFGGTDATETEPILRLAGALALAVIVAREQGLTFTEQLLRHVNQLLRGSLAT
jgi:hypothetical protein